MVVVLARSRFTGVRTESSGGTIPFIGSSGKKGFFFLG